MAAAETARLIASLELKDKLSGGIKSAQGGLTKFESRWDRVSGKVKTGLVVGAAAGVGIVAANIKAGLDSLASLEDAITSVDGAIAQVGPTWTTTGSQIAEVANRIEADIGAAFDDKDIIAGASALIRYGKVSEQNLVPAIEVMTDLAARTGSVESAADALSKALADPTKATRVLRQAGVRLTKDQQDQIETMVEVGDVAGAQAFLLRELEKTTKGAAEASQGPFRRSQKVLADTLEDAQRALAEGFLPVIEKVRDILQKGLADKRNIQAIRDFGKALAGGLDSLIEIVRNLPWSTIADSMRIAGMGAKALLDAFTSLPPWVQTAVLTGWGLNKVTGGLIGELGKGLIKGVLGMTAGVVNINAGVVNGGGVGAGAAAGAAAKGGGIAGVLGKLGVVAIAITGLAAAITTQQEQSNNSTTQAQAIKAGLDSSIAGKSLPELKTAMAGVKQGISDLRANPLLTLVQGEALTTLQAMESDLATQIARIESLKSQADRTKDDTVAATEKVKRATIETKRETRRGLDIVKTSTERVKAAALETKREAGRGLSIVNQSTRSGTTQVVGAIRANRPQVTTNVTVNVTASKVSKSVTEQIRVGPGTGSAGGGGQAGGGTGVGHL